MAYNAYAQTPPADALFGRPGTAAEAAAGDTVVCTNPAALAAGTGTLESQYRLSLPTQEVPGSATEGVIQDFPTVSTPWIQFNDRYEASCTDTNEANVLMVTPENNGPSLAAVPDAAWGLHVDDPNLALGNLVHLAESQASAYLAHQR